MMSTSFVGELCLRLHRARSCSSVTSIFSSVYCNCGITMVFWIARNLGNLIDELHLLILPSLTSSCAQSVQAVCQSRSSWLPNSLANLLPRTRRRLDCRLFELRFFCCAQVLLLTLAFLVSSLVLTSCRSALSRCGCSFTSCRSTLSRCGCSFTSCRSALSRCGCSFTSCKSALSRCGCSFICFSLFPCFHLFSFFFCFSFFTRPSRRLNLRKIVEKFPL